MKTVEAIAAALRAEGVEVVFNVPDEVTVFVSQALVDLGTRVVRPRHEQNGVVMADGYARATGSLGVCVLGPGPALAQTGTGLVTAVRRQSPLLVLLGSVPENRGTIKSFDARRFVESTGATYLEIRGSNTIASDLHEAFRLVRLRRGPVVIACGSGSTLNAEVDVEFSYPVTVDPFADPAQPTLDSSAIEEAAGMLANSSRPLILAGRGAVDADAREALTDLADRTGAILATSVQAREYFSGHHRYVGTVGTFASEAGGDLILSSDCVVAAGIALNPYQILAPKARVIHIDRDPARIGTHRQPDLRIVGDAATTARAIDACLARAGIAPRSFWVSEQGEVKVRETLAGVAPPPVSDLQVRPLPIRSALSLADGILPEQRFVVIDAGLFLGFAFDGIRVTDPKNWIWSMDFGSIGLGLGMSIGAAIARPDRICTAILGDGGFMMAIQELETAVREKVRLIIVVMNDSAYGAEVRVLEDNGLPGDIARHDDVDFAAVAMAFGAKGMAVRGPEDVGRACEMVSELGDEVLVLDFKVSEHEHHRLMDAVAMMTSLH